MANTEYNDNDFVCDRKDNTTNLYSTLVGYCNTLINDNNTNYSINNVDCSVITGQGELCPNEDRCN